jgi:hypothetical protein
MTAWRVSFGEPTAPPLAAIADRCVVRGLKTLTRRI